MTQSASILITTSADVSARARFRAIDWPSLEAVSTSPRTYSMPPIASCAIAAVPSVDPSLETITRTGPPYRAAAASTEASSLATFAASL
jgi:hypothetical protein